MSNKVNIYTDGSAIGNPGPGGYGIIMEWVNKKYIKEFSDGYQMTTKGIQLNIQKDIPIQTSSTKKFSEEQVALIQSFQPHIESKQITKTKLLTKLELEHSIKISSGTLTKILTNVY